MIFKSKKHEELYKKYMAIYEEKIAFALLDKKDYKGFAFALSATEEDLSKEISDFDLNAIEGKKKAYLRSNRLLIDLALNCFSSSTYESVNLKEMSESFNEDDKGVLVEYLRIIL